MGDPWGIGPEVTVKALSDPALRAAARFRLVGLHEPLARAAAAAGIGPFWSAAAGAEVVLEEDPALAAAWQAGLPAGDGAPRPRDTALGGAASFRFVERAIEAVRAGVAAGLVTAPISKQSWSLAGHGRYPGHTELLAERFDSPRSAMFFVGPRLRLVLATVHIPLGRVAAELTTQRVLDAIELGEEACRRLGVARPRVAVCGLNPHAGEGGLLGEEDGQVIAPAIAAARAKGIDASGPHSADAVFLDAVKPAPAGGRFDLFVAMYHDQGLIPVKLLDRDESVNVTLGLAAGAAGEGGDRGERSGGLGAGRIWGAIRTSPAHGTAFDIAGSNRADPASMAAAVRLAVRLAGG